MVKTKELIKVQEKDAKKLTNTIVEVDAYKELYEQAVKQVNYSSNLFKNLLENYMKALQNHKAVWKEILLKYVDEENVLYYREMYKFDVYKKVIFFQENEEQAI